MIGIRQALLISRTAAASLLLWSAAAWAQGIPVSQVVADRSFARIKAPEPGTLVVVFKGGLVEKNIAAVLETLSTDINLIPAEPHIVGRGETVCNLMHAKGLPGGCAHYLKVVRALNPAIGSLDDLKIGQTVTLPVLDLRVRSAKRSTAISPNRLSELVKNWSAANAKAASGNESALIEYDTFELRVKAKEQGELVKAQKALVELKLLNTSFQSLPFEAAAGVIHGRSAQSIKLDCQNSTLQTNPVDYFSYAFDDDPASRLDEVAGESPWVYILDVPLISAPNLANNANGPAQWKCEWFDFDQRNHATHLAGIIASKKPYGFTGIAPQARIKDLPYLTVPAGVNQKPQVDSERRYDFADLFAKPPSDGPLPVFLIASVLYMPTDFVGLPGQRLPTGDHRFNGQNAEISDSIREGRPMLIVSAGQANEVEPVRELDDKVPMIPQNLGDLPNVLVVTACSKCVRKGATILPEANYDKDRRFVHVAAPGGAPLPGWVNNEGIGAEAGTSQAAGYVAGVAALMVSRYPRIYREASALKKRIQATSWPLLAADSRPAPGAGNLAMGIVDPELASRDPQQDWVRRGQQGWQPVRVRGWAPRNGLFRIRGATRSLDLLPALRLIQQDSRYYIYTELDDAQDDETATLKTIEAGTLEGEPKERPRLVLCDGGEIPISEVLDFVANADGLPRTAQREALRCSGA